MYFVKSVDYSLDLDCNVDENLFNQYKDLELDYIRFFRMDMYSKMIFLNVYKLIKQTNIKIDELENSIGFFLLNTDMSMLTDVDFHQLYLDEKKNSSANVFRYTLSNMCMAETMRFIKGYGISNCFTGVPSSHIIEYANSFLDANILKAFFFGEIKRVEKRIYLKLKFFKKNNMENKIDKRVLKEKLIERLNLVGIGPNDIDDNLPFFGGEGLGLDSIDSLEIISMLEDDYGLHIDEDEDLKPFLENINTLFELIIQKNSKKIV